MAQIAGKRLLPALVDEISLSDPHRVFYSVPKTKNIADGFQDINARIFAQAVDRCSWYIEENLGRGHDFPTLTYLGPQDVVYGILILACIKTGYKLLLNSPRNTLEAHLSLFEKTECNTFLLPPNFPLPVVKQILAARSMKVVEIPGMQHWIEDAPVARYPYNKTYAEAEFEPFVVLHTSGSTGLPKPIIQTHATLSALDAFAALASSGQQSTYPAMCAGTRVYLAFPLFHCAGSSMLLPGSIFGGFTIVLGPFPPSAEVANSVHLFGNVQHSCFAPMTIIDLAKDPKYLDGLGLLKQITFGGGPLPREIGNLVQTKTRLLNVLGTTECGILPGLLSDPEDWEYMSVSKSLGHEYRLVSEGLYEQVVVKTPGLRSYQGIFGTFPELDEWPMKDLYSKHPTKSNTWLYRGRADDIVVFSNGEKLNPVDMEDIITAHPAVSAALITGLGRVQAGVLVEAVKPPASEEEKLKLLDQIWPAVQAANKESPSYGQIHRDMVMFTAADKPMLRAGKGTVQRKLTLDAYATEVDLLYMATENQFGSHTNSAYKNGKLANGDHTNGNHTNGNHMNGNHMNGNHMNGNHMNGNHMNGNHIDSKTYSEFAETVKFIINQFTAIDVEETAFDANLFELGLDSLQVILITKEVNKFLAAKGVSPSLEVKTVYSNPSMADLTKALTALAEGKQPAASVDTDEQKMQKIFDLYAGNTLINARKSQPHPPNSSVILLTGSTGSLGSYILNYLANEPSVSQIYCLNRGSKTTERQQKSQLEKGMQMLSPKIKCIDAKLSEQYFGLSKQDYMTLLSDVTTVIHNAWQVDFNLNIDAFVSQIGGVQRIIDFSTQSRFGAEIFFISSVAAVVNWSKITSSNTKVPEAIFNDWRMPRGSGYGESKFVSECLLDKAASEMDIPTTVCRVGQVAGPTTEAGVWPKQEWLPSLIASSKFLGKIPSSLGPLNAVDWIPVNVLGKSIVELVLSPTNPTEAGAKVYHAVNPQATTWDELAPTVARILSETAEISIVTLQEWVDALRESVARTDVVAQNPAIKILKFFESLVDGSYAMVSLDTKASANASPTLGSLGSIKSEMMENWMKQWSF